MLKDKDFDTVYFSEYLKNPISEKHKGFAQIYRDLETVLKRHRYETKLLPYKKHLVMDGFLSVWCRDYMPIHTVRRDLIDFAYTPNYLNAEKYKGHEPDSHWVCEELGIRALDYSTDEPVFNKKHIVLDGGNIVRCGEKVIMTNKVFIENPHYEREKLTKILEVYFDAKIVFLPWDSREHLGHADGILHYISGNKVVMDTTGVTSRNGKDRKFANAYRQVLEENDLEVLPLDFTDIDEDASNRWAYTNWLQMNGLIILPSLRDTPRSNERAYEQIEKYTRMSHLAIEMVDATDLIKVGGGAFNCASWTTTEAAVKDYSHKTH